MRVTIAALGCLLALVRAELAFAADGTDPSLSVAHTAFAASGNAPSTPSGDGFARGLGGVGECSEPTRVIELAIVAGPADSAPAEETGVLWCVTPDDPRCAPVDGGSRGGFNVAREKFACSIDCELDGPIARAVSGHAPAERMDDLRDGVALRIERPPRGAR
jgi:hypothetical protein